MKVGQLAAQVAKKEGHKSQARIVDIADILGIVAEICYDDPAATLCIQKLGIARSKRKKKNALASQS